MAKRRPLTKDELQLIMDLAEMRRSLHFGIGPDTFLAYHRLSKFVWSTIPDEPKKKKAQVKVR